MVQCELTNSSYTCTVPLAFSGNALNTLAVFELCETRYTRRPRLAAFAIPLTQWLQLQLRLFLCAPV